MTSGLRNVRSYRYVMKEATSFYYRLFCPDTVIYSTLGWRKNCGLCSSSFTLITSGRIETYQIATYSIRTLLKMDYWSPKHVELLNVINKVNHQILCILLDYGHIAKWYTLRSIQYHINVSWYLGPQNRIGHTLKCTSLKTSVLHNSHLTSLWPQLGQLTFSAAHKNHFKVSCR